jgi:hypothetical protein
MTDQPEIAPLATPPVPPGAGAGSAAGEPLVKMMGGPTYVWNPSWTPGTTTVAATAAWAAGLVTLTVATMTIPIGSLLLLNVAGFLPTGYNGSFTGKVASATTITYPLASNPGVETQAGTATYSNPPVTPTAALAAAAVEDKTSDPPEEPHARDLHRRGSKSSK